MTQKTQRWFSTLAIFVGVGMLIFLGLWYAYDSFYSWLGSQRYYLVTEYNAEFDIPRITPTPVPTLTPMPTLTPTSTPDPEPLPIERIIIPSIGVNEKVVEIGIVKVGYGENARFVWDTATYAVGHRKNSAYPEQRGNIVLSGHNNTKGEAFRYLSNLQPGDLIYLYTLDEEYVYVVMTKDLVPAVGANESDNARHARYTARTPDSTLTLISCWPYVTYTHRIYIVAKPQE